MSAEKNRLSGVTQTGNLVEGHLAGRDVNIMQGVSRPTHMGRLIQEFHEQRRNDQVLERTIESLDVFLRRTEGDPKGLEQKLSDAARTDELRSAETLKELFHKKLTLHQLTPAAQEIFAIALAKVQLRFQAEVSPLLHRRESKAEVDRAVLKQVVEPTYEELEHNPMDLGPHEIKGMVYYLTGNCHLTWV
jgi:hypothetical protein